MTVEHLKVDARTWQLTLRRAMAALPVDVLAEIDVFAADDPIELYHEVMRALRDHERFRRQHRDVIGALVIGEDVHSQMPRPRAMSSVERTAGYRRRKLLGIVDVRVGRPRATVHGTAGMARQCRCELCRGYQRNAQHSWRIRNLEHARMMEREAARRRRANDPSINARRAAQLREQRAAAKMVRG